MGVKEADELASKTAEAVGGLISEADARAGEIIRDAQTKARRLADYTEAQAEARAMEIVREAEIDAAHIRGRADRDARKRIEAARRALDEFWRTFDAESSDPSADSESPLGRPGLRSLGQPSAKARSRLLAAKLALDGKSRMEIEAEIAPKLGVPDRTALLDDVLGRVGH
jgi:vacuolar-type H+-ATPase subunit H